MEREAGKSGTNEKRGSALSKRRRGLLVGLRFVTRFEFGAARVVLLQCLAVQLSRAAEAHSLYPVQ